MAATGMNGEDEAHLRVQMARLDERITQFGRIMDERDKQYQEKFRRAEANVSTAFAASEKATASAFSAQKEAVIKAEEAQKTYNVGHNDLSRKMDAIYKDMMPRPEAMALFKALEDKLAAAGATADGKLDALRAEVADLRKSRDTQSGGRDTSRELWGYAIAVLSLILSAAYVILATHKP